MAVDTTPMTRIAVSIFSLACLLSLNHVLSNSARAQAWTQEAGSVYTKLFYGESAATDQYAFDGTLKPFSENVSGDAYKDQALYLYAEVGLTNSFSFFITVPYKRITVLDSSFRYRTTAVGSTSGGFTLSLKRLLGWQESRNALSISALGSVPTGYTRNYAPSAGTGQLDAGLLLSYGRSFYPSPAYFQISGGYEYRSELYGFSVGRDCQVGQDLDCVLDARPAFDDQFLYSAELGVDVAGRVLIHALVGGIWSVQPPETGFTVYNPYPSRQRYVKTGAGMRLRLGSVGLSGQMRFTPYGNNTVKSVDYFVGIDISFSVKKCCKEADKKTSTKEKTKPKSAGEPFSKPHQRRY